MPSRCWEVLDSQTILKTAQGIAVTIETVRLPDGRVVEDYYQIETHSAACVFAETRSGEIVTIQHYSHGAREMCVGLPSGRIDLGETPLDAARRELLEETGYVADAWECLGSFVRNGSQGGGSDFIFHAVNARYAAAPDTDDLEEIEVKLMSRAALRDALEGGLVAVSGHALASMFGLLRVNSTPAMST